MIVFDLEMTGLDPRACAVVSMGAVDINDPSRWFYKEFRVWEGARIDDDAMAVNGFTNAQVLDQSKPTFAEAADEIIAWIDGCSSQILCGQNVMFDINFLKAELERAGKPWPWGHRSVDTHSIIFCDRWKRENKEPLRPDGHSAMGLEAFSRAVGVPFTRGMTHNALEDAKLTAECLSRLLFDKRLFEEFDG